MAESAQPIRQKRPYKKRDPEAKRPRLGAAPGSRNSIGDRAKQRRVELGLTQDQVTARLIDETEWDASPQQVIYIETKRRAVTDLEIKALAKVLHCGAAWLLDGAEADTRRDTGV